jgi:hypothetical protein
MNNRFSCLRTDTNATSSNTFLNAESSFQRKNTSFKSKNLPEVITDEKPRENSFLAKPSHNSSTSRSNDFKTVDRPNNFIHSQYKRQRDNNHSQSEHSEGINLFNGAKKEGYIEPEKTKSYVPGFIADVNGETIVNEKPDMINSRFQSNQMTYGDLLEHALQNPIKKKGKKKGKISKMKHVQKKNEPMEEFPTLGKGQAISIKDAEQFEKTGKFDNDFPSLPIQTKSKNIYKEKIDILKQAPEGGNVVKYVPTHIPDKKTPVQRKKKKVIDIYDSEYDEYEQQFESSTTQSDSYYEDDYEDDYYDDYDDYNYKRY